LKKKITYHQKLVYLLIGGGLFLIVLYNVSLSDTLDLVSENSILAKDITKNKNALQQIKIQKRKLANIQQILGNETYEAVDIQQALLTSITEYIQQNGMILKDFPKPFSLTDKGYITKTAMVTVEGDFIALLKLIYYLESDYKVGKVVAVDYKIFKESRTRKRKLNAIIYLQHVKNENDEENS